LPATAKELHALDLTIAGLGIAIRSVLRADPREDVRFRPFHAPKRNSVLIATHQIEPGDLIADKPDPEIDERLAPAGRRGVSSSLLRSMMVIERLDEAKGHTESLFVEMHPSRMTILDFHSGRGDFYFLSRKGRPLRCRWIGPAMLAPFLPRFDAIMLHASAIVRHGKAAVFLAPDEGGKTTAARLCPLGLILCDDQVIVRRSRGRFRAWGSPWGLHVDAKENAPLAGLFLLKKAKRFSLEPLPARELIPFIWGEIENSLSILPKPLKKKAFGIVCDIVAAAPAWTLSFAKDHIDWEQVDRALQRATHG
jgi:hypothetical protein